MGEKREERTKSSDGCSMPQTGRFSSCSKWKSFIQLQTIVGKSQQTNAYIHAMR